MAQTDWFYFPRFCKWPTKFWFGLTKHNSLSPSPNFSLWPLGGKKQSFVHFWLIGSPASDLIFIWLIWKQHMFNPEMLFVHGPSIVQRDSFCWQSLCKSKQHRRNLLWPLYRHTWTCRFFLAKLIHCSKNTVKTEVLQHIRGQENRKKKILHFLRFFFSLRTLIQKVCYWLCICTLFLL